VRRLEPGDLEALYAIRLGALASDPDAFLRTHDEENARGLAFAARVLGDREGNGVFGAVGEGGALVGMVGVYREAPVKWRHRMTLWGMFVAATARGRGVGGRLVDAGIAFARDLAGIRQLHLSVEARHVAALELYRSRGFLAWGTEARSQLTQDGRELDEIHMWLDLERAPAKG
jgi:GNAT superfamily N-acetyltransferase